MASITKSVDVEVPLSTVYNQWTQFEEFPKFMKGVERIDQIDATHTHWKVKVGGVEREFDAVITEQHPDERVAWASHEGEKQAGVVTFHRLSDTTTRVTLQLDWEPQGALEKVGSILQIDDAQVTGDLKRFAAFIEGRGSETGAYRGDEPVSPTA